VERKEDQRKGADEIGEILGSHGSEYENDRFLGYGAV
jgi:hypothetical protein